MNPEHPAAPPEPDVHACLLPGALIDSAHPDVRAFTHRVLADASDLDARERAVRLYYAVRDGFRYDPYTVDLSPDGMRASRVLEQGHGWCINKAALLAAACRVAGVPARVGFADVRNHLSTERMRKVMDTDVFHWHGYTSIQLDGRWLKATPAFNLSLCERFRLQPLEFDGTQDSIYHPFDLSGQRHMEYLLFRGEYADVPLERIRADFARLYPQWSGLDQADFEGDIEREQNRR